MNIVSANAGGASYDVLVGRGLLPQCGALIAARLSGPHCALVADEKTAPIFADKAEASLRSAGFTPVLITIPAGEAAKSLAEAGRVCDEMTAAGLDRSSFVVALGGGVVGDVAGFAAAIYHRGIPHVQIPTTLLAQVDSAIGGKTAVNTAHGKNLLGAVHQPALVLADVDTLGSLPAREFNQGLAEVIKHAAIADASLFELLQNLNRDDLTELVRRNVEIKAAVVARDERDVSGARAILNFGHTVGHALERVAGYGTFLHGEAISLGMAAAAEVSVRKAGLSETERRTIVTHLERFNLPTKLPPDFPRASALSAVQTDKKFSQGAVRFVVCSRLGSAHLATDVTLEDIRAALALL